MVTFSGGGVSPSLSNVKICLWTPLPLTDRMLGSSGRSQLVLWLPRLFHVRLAMPIDHISIDLKKSITLVGMSQPPVSSI